MNSTSNQDSSRRSLLKNLYRELSIVSGTVNSLKQPVGRLYEEGLVPHLVERIVRQSKSMEKHSKMLAEEAEMILAECRRENPKSVFELPKLNQDQFYALEFTSQFMVDRILYVATGSFSVQSGVRYVKAMDAEGKICNVEWNNTARLVFDAAEYDAFDNKI
jgi:hypothetical protein